MNHPKVIQCLRGGVGGVDVFACNLTEQLLRRGVPARILLTSRAKRFLPESLPIDRLPIRPEHGWPARWRMLAQYLKAQAPCIFFPNYEYDYSGISPVLPDDVMIIGVIHSDESIYYDHVLRLGKYWNATVAVSNAIAEHVSTLPLNGIRNLTTIPYGVSTNPEFETKKSADGESIKIVFVGRLAQLQKRVLDLPEIFRLLIASQTPIEFTVVGDGFTRSQLEKECHAVIPNGLLRFTGALRNDEVLKLLDSQDIILLTSDFEGLPIAILEAMGRGCIPIVPRIRSGIPQLIRDGYNGFIIEPGNFSDYVRKISLLQQDTSLRRKIAAQSFETIRAEYSLEHMADNYLKLFEIVQRDREQGVYHRPSGKILPPPDLELSWKQYVPTFLRTSGLKVRKLLGRRQKQSFHLE